MDTKLSNLRMHKSLDEIMWPNRYLLTGLGIWPSPSNTRLDCRYFNYFRIVISLAFITFMTYPLVVTIAVNWGDIDLLASFGSVAIMYTLGALKVIYMIFRHRACKRVYKYLTNMWNASNDTEERFNFEPFAEVAQKITIAAFASAVMDCVAFMLSPVIVGHIARRSNDSTLSLPLPVLYGFDYTRRDIFALLYAGQGLGSTICCMAIFGSDCTFMSVIFQLAGQFRLANFRLRVIGQRINDEKFDSTELVKDIGRCVDHHQRTIRIVDEVNNVLEPIAFGQIATSGFVLCLCGFVIITGNPLDPDMLKIYVLFACIIVQLMIWCWPGELIIQESGAIAHTIYHGIPWLSVPPSIRRDLNFIVMRAQRKCKIVGFYQVMSMRKLTEVFNAAGSYMALLRSIRN